MIRSIRLRNFKCFQECLLPMGGLTLLCGVNGTGKSSVMQSLLLLRQSYQQGLLDQGKLALNGEWVQIGTGYDALYSGAQEDIISFELETRANGRAGWNFSYDDKADVLTAGTSVLPGIFQENLFGEGFQYLGAERIGPRTAFQTSDFAVRQHRQLGNRGEFAAHFLSVYGESKVTAEALLHSQAVSSKLTHQVESWLGAVSPGTRLELTPHAGMDLVQLRYQFVSGRDVSDSYRPTNVGFGITYTLPIIVAALAAGPDSLLLIENPEAHLHAVGQEQMGRFLARTAKAGVQVIIETHSEHVLNGIRLAVHDGALEPEHVNIHFFARSEGMEQLQHKVLSPRMDRHGRIDAWPEGFFDQWDRSLEALLALTRE